MGNTSNPTTDDHHFRREVRTLRWQRISAHIAEHPADLSIALDNIDRWLALGRVHPAPLIEWRDRIHAAQNSPEAFQDLVNFFATPNHDSERIKSCSPFAGLSCLNPTEVSQALQSSAGKSTTARAVG